MSADVLLTPVALPATATGMAATRVPIVAVGVVGVVVTACVAASGMTTATTRVAAIAARARGSPDEGPDGVVVERPTGRDPVDVHQIGRIRTGPDDQTIVVTVVAAVVGAGEVTTRGRIDADRR